MSNAYQWIRRPVMARFRERLNRFACRVDLAGTPTKVYLPNSGRLEDLLIPGAKVLLEQCRQPGEGKTLHDMLLVQSHRYPDRDPLWVGLDSRLPPRLVQWALDRGALRDLARPSAVETEPQVAHGRLDLRLTTADGEHYVETKSVNLLDRDGVARFPDAPTSRGTRHLETLIEMHSQGVQAWVIFVIMRSDAVAFSPFAERDPDFADALVRARDAGVRVRALSFAAGPTMRLRGATEVRLPASPFPGFWPPKDNV